MVIEMIKINDIVKKIRSIEGKTDWYSLLNDIFEVGAIAISNQFDRTRFEQREETYKRIMSKYNEKEQLSLADAFADIYELLSQMSKPDGLFDDYLGRLYMESGTQSKGAGQFFTPYTISKICAEITIKEETVKEKFDKNPNHVITICEPTCGSGGMILAAIEQLRKYGVNYAYNSLVECGDIDKRCVHMTYLQLSLAGVPAIIYHQDTLTLETWDVWHTPAYCMNYLHFKNANKINHLDKPSETTIIPQVEEKPKEQPKEQPKEEKKPIVGKQLSLFDFEF